MSFKCDEVKKKLGSKITLHILMTAPLIMHAETSWTCMNFVVASLIISSCRTVVTRDSNEVGLTAFAVF